MRQLSYLLRKEFLELVRTKRALVLLIVFGIWFGKGVQDAR